MKKKNSIITIDGILTEYKLKNRHSYYQLQFFVIGKEPTMQGKMRQCILELQSRKTTMDNVTLEMEEVNDKLELLDLEIEKIEFEGTAKKEREIKTRMLKRQQVALRNKLNELQQVFECNKEEAEFILGLFSKFKETEELKVWDDFNVQNEYWNNKLAIEIRSKILLGLPIDSELLKTIMSLPDDAPVKVETIKLINKPPEKNLE